MESGRELEDVVKKVGVVLCLRAECRDNDAVVDVVAVVAVAVDIVNIVADIIVEEFEHSERSAEYYNN